MSLAAERVWELLDYDSKTGHFFWRTARRGHRPDVAMPAGKISHGYVCIGIDEQSYKAHRLAWLYMTGFWPQEDIDHINGIRSDNRIENLREASHTINCQNLRRAPRTSKSGLLGVRLRGKRWTARIRVNDRLVQIGTFDSADEAYAAYVKAKRQFHEGCTL